MVVPRNVETQSMRGKGFGIAELPHVTSAVMGFILSQTQDRVNLANSGGCLTHKMFRENIGNALCNSLQSSCNILHSFSENNCSVCYRNFVVDITTIWSILLVIKCFFSSL